MANGSSPTQRQVVHAPAPNGTPPGRGTNEVAVPRAQNGNVNVQLTTVHNWMELVYRAFNQQLPTAAREVAILGVREAGIRSQGASGEALENRAAAGSANVEFTRGDRAASMASAPTAWDDLLFVAWTGNDAARTQHVDVYQCTIDPGRGISEFGTPYLLEGKLYHGYPGFHNLTANPGLMDISLHLYSETRGRIVLAREATNRTRIFRTLDSTRTHGGRFVLEEVNDTIHMHAGRPDTTVVGGSSVGCTVLKHRLPTPRYQHFKNTYNAAPNKQRVPYLVVSSDYVRSYGEWVREVDRTPGQTPAPRTVIIASELRSPQGVTGRYLPSIFSTEFANAALAGAANVRQSLERALFTCAT